MSSAKIGGAYQENPSHFTWKFFSEYLSDLRNVGESEITKDLFLEGNLKTAAMAWCIRSIYCRYLGEFFEVRTWCGSGTCSIRLAKGFGRKSVVLGLHWVVYWLVIPKFKNCDAVPVHS
jgi:hypothetical protein